MSFFGSKGDFLGFSSKWIKLIFSNHYSVRDLMQSFWLSLRIAGLATVVSCVIGTTAALALHRWKSKLQSIHYGLVYTPLIMPDILIGISLLMLFVACHVECGFWTILIAHVTFCVSYVTMTLLARLQDFDDRIIEAAYDLGAGPWYTFFKVELPLLMPGIVAGGLLAFTLSIDDVVITSFVNGAGTNTFPTYVSSMTKHSRNLPSVFALSTLMLEMGADYSDGIRFPLAEGGVHICPRAGTSALAVAVDAPDAEFAASLALSAGEIIKALDL
jgi:spermidine/putrescine transport system permease protein